MKIHKIDFEGSDAVELTTKKIRLVAVCEFGPRIAFFGKADEGNLLLWEPDRYRRGEWNLRGGHRVWITRPLADESEETYAPDNEAAKVEIEKNRFTLTGALDSRNRTRRGFTVKYLTDESVEIDNFIINEGDMLFSGGVWALTCTVPDKKTRYAIPLGDGSRWDMFPMVHFRAWGGHHGRFDDPQIRIREDVLTVSPRGSENKRMILAQKGIIAMCDASRRITFAKKVRYGGEDRYPLGCNLAFYIGPKNFMVELETMGPERTLKPGDSLHHIETWVLRDECADAESSSELAALF